MQRKLLKELSKEWKLFTEMTKKDIIDRSKNNTIETEINRMSYLISECRRARISEWRIEVVL